MANRGDIYKRDGLKSTITQKMRNEAFGKRCPTCDVVMKQNSVSRPSLDHIVPISLGGSRTTAWRAHKSLEKKGIL